MIVSSQRKELVVSQLEPEYSTWQCGCSEHVLAAMAASQWPRTCMSLSYYANTTRLSGMSESEFDAAIKESLQKCTEASGLDISRTTDRDKADIEMRGEPMRGGILAYAYLPSNTCRQVLAVRFNSNVKWRPDLFVDTSTHENGHTFGLSHTNDVRDIMYPSLGRGYDGRFSDHYSIPQLVSRYGPDADDDDDDDDNGGGDVDIIKIIEIIILLIDRCSDESDNAILQRMRNPAGMTRFIFERRVRHEMGYRPRQWRDMREKVMQEIYTLASATSDDDLREIIAEARDLQADVNPLTA